MRFLKRVEIHTIFPLFEGALETGKITKSAFRNWVVCIYSAIKYMLSHPIYQGQIHSPMLSWLSGSSLLRTQMSGTFLEWHKDSSSTASQASQCHCQCDHRSRSPHGHGRGLHQNNSLHPNSTAASGIHLSEHVQDSVWVHCVCLRDASFRHRRSLRDWRCSGNILPHHIKLVS